MGPVFKSPFLEEAAAGRNEHQRLDDRLRVATRSAQTTSVGTHRKAPFSSCMTLPRAHEFFNPVSDQQLSAGERVGPWRTRYLSRSGGLLYLRARSMEA